MKNNKNEVQLYGTLMDIQPDVFFKDDKKFKRIYIEVKRTSGAVDLLPVIVREGLSDAFPIGEHVYIEGRYISSNKHENGKSHLILEIKEGIISYGNEQERDENKIILEGYLCKPPVYRRTPSGKEICDLMIACNEYDLRRTDYIPCIAWWNEAREAADFKVGDFVKIIGRIQSRIYHKNLSGDEVELRTAYEVSIGRIIEHESGSKKNLLGELQEVSK
jgi:primosomal replication protein N